MLVWVDYGAEMTLLSKEPNDSIPKVLHIQRSLSFTAECSGGTLTDLLSITTPESGMFLRPQTKIS